MTNIAILIPCYNEEKTIRKVICDVKRDIPNSTIYVGNNNSSDNTKNIALEENVIVIDELKQGKANMVRKMFEEIEADIYVLIDGDDTYFSEDIVKCLNEALSQNADLVIGNRLAEFDNCNKTKIYSLGNYLANIIINFRYKSDIGDVMSGLRVMSKKLVKELTIKSEGFELETEITVFAIKNNLKIKNIPIKYKARPDGSISKLRTIRDGIKISRAVLKM